MKPNSYVIKSDNLDPLYNGQVHTLLKDAKKYAVSVCGMYFLYAGDGVYTAREEESHKYGACQVCQETPVLTVYDERVIGMSDSQHWAVFEEKISDYNYSDELSVQALNAFNLMMQYLPTELKHLIWTRVEMEREFGNIRCSVCGHVRDPECSSGC